VEEPWSPPSWLQWLGKQWTAAAASRAGQPTPARNSHKICVPSKSKLSGEANSLFVSLVYCAESTVRWFVVREKHCWMAADSADKSKRTGRKISDNHILIGHI
jgi:hypothetical protein